MEPGADLAALIAGALGGQRLRLADGDVLVVASKVVSKAEGRIVPLEGVRPSPLAAAFAADSGKDARVIELVMAEAKRIVKMARGVLIVETRHGLVCANAGVDRSNVDGGDSVCLLPVDPDRSARALRAALGQRLGVRPAVLISDSFGRPWRLGQTQVAIGTAGLRPLDDLRGQADLAGFELSDTQDATADALAAAAGVCFRKASGIAACLVRGFDHKADEASSARELIRPSEQDLFR